MKNAFGDVIGIVDASGNIVAKYVYDAWGVATIYDADGNITASGIGYHNRIRYRGYYYDHESGLYYLQSRYYDPQTGRFISADEAGIIYLSIGLIGGANLYAYCFNNPIMKTDSSGYFAITASLIAGIVFSMLIGGLISGGLAAATAAFTTEQNIGAAFWGGFVSGAIMSLGGSVALGLGPWGVLVAAGSGFLGGFLGNLVEQGISGRNVPNKSATNWNDALNAGVLYAIINTITFGIFRFYGWVGAEELLPIGGTILERVISSLSFNGYCLVTSAFFGTIMGVTETIVRVIEFYVTGGTYGYNNIEAKVMNTGIKALYVC